MSRVGKVTWLAVGVLSANYGARQIVPVISHVDLKYVDTAYPLSALADGARSLMRHTGSTHHTSNIVCHRHRRHRDVR